MKLLLVDDHAVVRSALARVLSERWEVAEAGSISEALRQAAAQTWDLVVIDAELGGQDGLELARRFQGSSRFMVLSMHSDPSLVRRAISVGARAFVVKEALAEEVLAATLVARYGGLYLDRRVASAFLNGAVVENRRTTILEALQQGMDNQAIAARVNLSLSSVKAELRALFREYGVKDRNELLKVLNLTL